MRREGRGNWSSFGFLGLYNKKEHKEQQSCCCRLVASLGSLQIKKSTQQSQTRGAGGACLVLSFLFFPGRTSYAKSNMSDTESEIAAHAASLSFHTPSQKSALDRVGDILAVVAQQLAGLRGPGLGGGVPVRFR